MAILAPLSGAISDRSGPRFPSAGGMLAIAGGLVAVASTADVPGPALVASLALVGVGLSTADAGLTILSIVAIAGTSVVWASTGVVRALAVRRRRDGQSDALRAATRTRS